MTQSKPAARRGRPPVVQAEQILDAARRSTAGLTMHGIARELGLTPRPGQLSVLEVGLDVMSAPAVADFWRAVLGYDTEAGSSVDEPALIDPAGRHAGLWFQQMDEPRTDRDRFHLDIVVAHDKAAARRDAAIAAGGRLVSEEFVPSWWILADADGNEVCVCTWQDREG